MVSKDIKVLKCEVLERTLMPDRTLIVDLEYNNTFIRALGLHSITGCQHGKAKAIQYYSFAEAIDTYKPDIVGIDANEPEMDHYEIEKMKFFDNYDKGMGCKTFFEIMNENSLADSFIKNYKKEDFIEGECLTTSYVKRGRKRVRYDFLFINSKKFEEYNCIYNYNDAVEAGSDHAAVIVDVKI